MTTNIRLRKLIGMALVVSMLIVSLGTIATAIESDFINTEYFFTITAAVSFNVEIPGPATFNSDPTNGTTDTTDFVFNVTNTTYHWADPVVSGSDVGQSSTRPMYNFTNTGTVPIHLNIHLNETFNFTNSGSCIGLFGGTTFATRGNNIINGSVNTTIIENLGVEASQPYYLTADFTNCNAANSTTRYGSIWGWNETI